MVLGNSRVQQERIIAMVADILLLVSSLSSQTILYNMHRDQPGVMHHQAYHLSNSRIRSRLPRVATSEERW
jgi:hypothetical protein